MYRVRIVALIALSGCAGAMVRAPKQIPADGRVECTDTLEAPMAGAVIALVSAVGVAYAAMQLGDAVDHGAIMWGPILGLTTIGGMESAGLGLSYADECRRAKQRGAEIAMQREARVAARAKAGDLWKHAAAAARAGDCATVRELDPQVQQVDVEFHAVVFSRDVAIERCVSTRE